jgi:DHA1 family tetracycline resistance protein-like MFS transporter
MPISNFRTATFILFVIVVVNLIGFGIVIPLLPFYGQHYGASPDQVALLLAIYSATQFVTSPLWGWASDRYGRRPILIASLAGTVLSYLWLAYASDLTHLFLSRALAGIMAGSISGAFAYMADITDDTNRSRGMGMIGAAFGLGFIAGPAIGGLLAGGDPATTDYRLPAFAAVAFSGLALILCAALLKESLPADVRRARSEQTGPRIGYRDTLAMPRVRLILVLTFIATFAFAGLEAVFALWTERTYGWGVMQNGYVFAFLGVISAILQGGLIGRLSKRFGDAGLVRQGLLTLAIGLAAIPFATNLPLLLIALCIATYGFSVCTPALNGLLTIAAPTTATGGVIGVGRSASTLARAAGPAFAGYIFTLFGKDWPFFTGAIILVIVLLLSRGLGRPSTVSSEDPRRSA